MEIVGVCDGFGTRFVLRYQQAGIGREVRARIWMTAMVLRVFSGVRGTICAAGIGLWVGLAEFPARERVRNRCWRRILLGIVAQRQASPLLCSWER